jgi:flagellar motility protein MotE (MotC chaperone)
MNRLLRDVRLIPVVLAATVCLFVLKTFGLIFDGGYTLNELARNSDDVDVTGTISGAKRPDGKRPDEPKIIYANKQDPTRGAKQGTGQSWAQQMFGYPDITGSVPAPKPAEPKDAAKGDKPGEKPAPKEPPPPVQQVVAQTPQPSKAERALLERLQERRLELDARAKDLEMKESLLKAAEKRLESRLLELKDVESRITVATQQKDEAEAARFKNLITMYESMKAKDAAKIFDRLDLKVLVDVAVQLNPRRMSDIMAQMAPDSAERLTVELAARARESSKPAELPKIEGKPLTN